MNGPTHHLPHVLMLLHAVEKVRNGEVSSGEVMPPEVFLAREEKDTLWELIALRLQGLPSLLLGGVRFRRQESGRGRLARQSLVSYLSAPLKEVRADETPRPTHLVEVMLPDAREPILKFLQRARKGEDCPTLLLDRDDVLFAFDFRLENPSRMRHAQTAAAAAAERYLFRTTSGHVLSAAPHRLPTKLHRDDPFLALTRPTQHSATVDLELPTLVVHRSFLSMTAQVQGGLTPWLHHTQPFHVDQASADHLLDPELEQYRTYRSRVLEDQRAGHTGGGAARSA